MSIAIFSLRMFVTSGNPYTRPNFAIMEPKRELKNEMQTQLDSRTLTRGYVLIC